MKISQILKETNIHQITGALIKFDDNDELIGKCALGVLACESKDKSIHLSSNIVSVAWDKILESYGINIHETYPSIYLHGGWCFDNDDTGMSIHIIIIELNDRFMFTFKEIGEFLEVTYGL